LISSPGCYQLTSDNQTGLNGLTVQVSNVTVLGNGHTITGTNVFGLAGGGVTGILIQDLTTDSKITIFGNSSTTQTSPAVHLNRVNYTNVVSNPPNPIATLGNNIFLEHGAVTTYPNPSASPVTGADDPLLVEGVHIGPGSNDNVPARWVVVDSFTFGPNFDLGLEGITAGWDHCTISNCVSTQGAFGGFGGWYEHFNAPVDGNCGFIITNCTFVGNTLTSWRFCTPQNPSDAAIGSFVDSATSDADANAKWGTGTAFGNVFGGAGPLANTYVALTREQCEARAAMYAANRRNPPDEWPPGTWNEIITCP
jgi:hypothetical protein